MAQSKAPGVVTRLRSRRILVVDSDADSRADCVAVLKDAGFQVSEASDAREGFAVASSEQPDLVVFVPPGGRLTTKTHPVPRGRQLH